MRPHLVTIILWYAGTGACICVASNVTYSYISIVHWFPSNQVNVKIHYLAIIKIAMT